MTASNINIPVVNAGYLSVQGMQLAWVDNTHLTMNAGQARDSTDVNDIVLGASVTINAAANGYNGLDTGSLAASKVYAVYAIGDSSQNNPAGAVLSLNQVNPLLPINYDMYRLIGYYATDGSSHFLKGYWSGNSNQRLFMYDAPISVGTTSTSASYANVDLTTFVPLINNLPVYLNASISGTAGDTLSLQPGNATGDAVVIEAQVNSQAVKQQVLVMAQTVSLTGVPSPVINYKNSGTDTIALLVGGYNFSI